MHENELNVTVQFATRKKIEIVGSSTTILRKNLTLQVILRIVPTILIFSLNIWIYLRLKAISKRRKKALGKRNQDNWRTKIKRYRSRSSRASSAHSVDVSVISSSVLSTAPPPSIVVEPPSEEEEEEDFDRLSVIEEEEQEEVCRLPVPDLIMDVNRARQAPPKQQQQQQQQQPPSSKKAASEDALRSALRLSLLSSVAATAVSFSDTVDVISLAPTVYSSALSLNNVGEEEEEKEQKKRGSWRPRKIVNTFAR